MISPVGRDLCTIIYIGKHHTAAVNEHSTVPVSFVRIRQPPSRTEGLLPKTLLPNLLPSVILCITAEKFDLYALDYLAPLGGDISLLDEIMSILCGGAILRVITPYLVECLRNVETG